MPSYILRSNYYPWQINVRNLIDLGSKAVMGIRLHHSFLGHAAHPSTHHWWEWEKGTWALEARYPSWNPWQHTWCKVAGSARSTNQWPASPQQGGKDTKDSFWSMWSLWGYTEDQTHQWQWEQQCQQEEKQPQNTIEHGTSWWLKTWLGPFLNLCQVVTSREVLQEEYAIPCTMQELMWWRGGTQDIAVYNQYAP